MFDLKFIRLIHNKNNSVNKIIIKSDFNPTMSDISASALHTRGIHCTLYKGDTLYTLQGGYTVHYTRGIHCTLYKGETLHTIQGGYTVLYTRGIHCTLYKGDTLYTIQGGYTVHYSRGIHVL